MRVSVAVAVAALGEAVRDLLDVGDDPEDGPRVPRSCVRLNWYGECTPNSFLPQQDKGFVTVVPRSHAVGLKLKLPNGQWVELSAQRRE